MTPDETSPSPLDPGLLARVMACDEALQATSFGDVSGSVAVPSTVDGDNRARSRLMLLLAILEAAESSGDRRSVAGEALLQTAPDEKRPLLGRFEILDELGSGGFGFVVRARDRLLGREVALKMPLPERLLNAGDVNRFLHEARAAARLDHPNIVRVFEAGALGPLGYYIASEFCAGPTMRGWLKARNEAVPARLAARWAGALADAVKQAHDRGILHRDIKPSNVILSGGPAPEDFVPRLTDFGLAKLIDEGGDETRSNARIGTPDYMAPEVAAGRRRDLGPAADIYSLGATLYEILAGRPPLRGENDAETVRLVIEAEPVSLRSLRPGLPRDLETICLKCLRKEPLARYGRAEELRDDLQRFLEGRPIRGRPVSSWERARRWARRRPAVAALSVLVALMTCGLVAGIVAWASWLEGHNRQLEFQIARADHQTIEAKKQGQIAQERERHADRHRFIGSLRRAREALDARQIELAQDILHDIDTEPHQSDPRGFAWGYLWRQANRDFTQLWGHEAAVNRVVVSQVGKTLATRDIQEKILVWNLAPDMKLDKPRAVFSCSVANVAGVGWVIYSPDVRYVAKLSWGPSIAAIDLHETISGRLVARFEGEVSEQPRGLGFDPESQRLVLAVERPDGKHLVRWWRLTDEKHDAHCWLIEKGASLALLPHAARFVAFVRDNRLHFFDPWSGEPQVCLAESDLSPSGLGGLNACSADGRYFAAHTQADQILLWDRRFGCVIGRFAVPGGLAMAMSPKGARLAVMDGSGAVTIFDRSLKLQKVLVSRAGKHTLFDRTMSFSSDETLLAINIVKVPGGPQPPEVWDIATCRLLDVFPGRQDVRDLAFVPGTRSLILAGGTNPRIWRLDPPSAPEDLSGHRAEAWTVAFSPDGNVLASGSDDTDERQTIKLWDPARGRPIAGWKAHTATVASLAFSPDGRRLASSSLDSGKPGNPNVLIWDAASHQCLASLEGHNGSVRSLAFSPDGRLLATAGDDLQVRLWDTTSNTTQAILHGHSANVTGVAFSPDSRLLASASNDATVRLWDVFTGQPRGILHHYGNVNAVAFAPDGALVASADENGQIKLWNPETTACVQTIHCAADQLRCLAFTRDGSKITVAGKERVVRLCDVATGQEVLSLTGHKMQINAVAFSPIGAILASCSHDGAVKLWRAEPIDVVPAR